MASNLKTPTCNVHAKVNVFNRKLRAEWGGLNAREESGAVVVTGRNTGIIDLTNLNLQGSLVFRKVVFKCAFTAQDMQIKGSVIFDRCTFEPDESPVNLEGLRCGGNLEINGLQCKRVIKLSGSQIEGSIYAKPIEITNTAKYQPLSCQGFTCSDARIGGTVFLEGIRTEAPKDGQGNDVSPGSIRFVRSTIRGSLILTYRLKHSSVLDWKQYQPSLSGRLDLEACRIESSLIARGLKCQGINLILAEIGGTCSLRAWHPVERNDPLSIYELPLSADAYRSDSAVPTNIEGSLKARHVIIRGSLNLSGATVKEEVDLRNSTIGALACHAWRRRDLVSTKTFQPSATSLIRSPVHTNQLLTQTDLGSLVISDSTIKGDIEFVGSKIKNGIRANNCSIHGSVTVRVASAGKRIPRSKRKAWTYLRTCIGRNHTSYYDNSSFQLEESRISGNVSISGADVSGVNLSRSIIEGSLYLTSYKVGNSVKTIETRIEEASRGDFRYSLKMTDTEVKGVCDWSKTLFLSGVIADGASFGNDLRIFNSKLNEGKYVFNNNTPIGTIGLYLALAKIDGDLLIDNFSSDSALNLTGANVQGSLSCTNLSLKAGSSLTSESYSLHARGLRVSGFTTFQGNCETGVVLSGASLGNNVVLDFNINDSGANGKSKCGLRMRNTKVDGKLLLQGAIQKGVSLEGVRILGSARFKCRIDSPGIHANAQTQSEPYGITLAAADISGETHFENHLVTQQTQPVDLSDAHLRAGLFLTEVAQRHDWSFQSSSNEKFSRTYFVLSVF